jgi:hypothetical protein
MAFRFASDVAPPAKDCHSVVKSLNVSRMADSSGVSPEFVSIVICSGFLTPEECNTEADQEKPCLAGLGTFRSIRA